MGKVYVTQENLIIYVNTDSSLVEAANVVLAGTDPLGSDITPLNAVIEDSASGLVSRTVNSADFPSSGTYILWAKVNYIGGGSSWGEPFHLNVYDTGN